MAKKMTEAQLAQRFIEYFGEAEIYKEVPLAGGICDFVINQSPVYIAVEVKASMSMDVLAQALDKVGYANYVYIAVPASKGRRDFVEAFCKDKGIGLLYFNKTAQAVYEQVKPRLFRKIVKPTLEEWMKHNTAGSQSERMTAFKYFVEKLYETLHRAKTGYTYEELFKRMDHQYYKSLSSFKNNLYQYSRRDIIPHLIIEKGTISLDREGYVKYLESMRKQFGRYS